jgi:hypothetical protein
MERHVANVKDASSTLVYRTGSEAKWIGSGL